MWIKYRYCCNSFIPKTIGKAMGTHKNKKNIVNDKEKIEEVLRLIKKLLIHKRYKTIILEYHESIQNYALC